MVPSTSWQTPVATSSPSARQASTWFWSEEAIYSISSCLETADKLGTPPQPRKRHQYTIKRHQYTIQYTLGVYVLRTNIVLDDELVEEAFRRSDARTKRKLVDLALREFVENRRRRAIRELRGKDLIRPDYEYKALREGL